MKEKRCPICGAPLCLRESDLRAAKTCAGLCHRIAMARTKKRKHALRFHAEPVVMELVPE